MTPFEESVERKLHGLRVHVASYIFVAVTHL